MLNKLSFLINGTLADSVYEYSNSPCMGDISTSYCSNGELVSTQWVSGLLTQKEIYKHLYKPLNFTFHDINSTIPNKAELGIYTPSNIDANDGMNLLRIDDDKQDMIPPTSDPSS